MKKIYEKPEISVESFDLDDIIRTSDLGKATETDDVGNKEDQPTWNLF